MAITEIRLITDLPAYTGWLDGYRGRRRVTYLASPDDADWYQKGWRRGCRDAFFDDSRQEKLSDRPRLP